MMVMIFTSWVLTFLNRICMRAGMMITKCNTDHSVESIEEVLQFFSVTNNTAGVVIEFVIAALMCVRAQV